MNELVEVNLFDLQPNPFRDITTYPFDEDKIGRLVESINSTGFWPSVIARKAGAFYEIAFGHHRVEAARRAHVDKATIVIQNLTDDEMLKMMVDENAIEYGHDFLSTLNSVGAVVRAYGQGAIKLESPVTEGKVRKDKYRSAPSFLPEQTSDAQNLYTASTIGLYLGWIRPGGQVDDRVNVAISALELVERGLCTVEQFRGLSGQAARALVRDAQIALKYEEKHLKLLEDAKDKSAAEKEAKLKLQRDLQNKAEALKKGDITSKQLMKETKEKTQTFLPKEKPEGKDISKLVASTTAKIQKILDTLSANENQLKFLYSMIENSANTCSVRDLNALRLAWSRLSTGADANMVLLDAAVVERRNGE